MDHPNDHLLQTQSADYLEDKLMRELALRQTPASLEVLGEVVSLFDGGQDSSVDSLLIGCLGFGDGLLGFGLAILEELLLCGA